MTKADELNALADRCEREEESDYLDNAIGRAFGWVEHVDDSVLRRSYRYWTDPEGDIWHRPDWTRSLDAAVTLEPKDAQEIVVRTYPNGGAYVRITLKSGKVGYCEKFAGKITEPMA